MFGKINCFNCNIMGIIINYKDFDINKLTNDTEYGLTYDNGGSNYWSIKFDEEMKLEYCTSHNRLDCFSLKIDTDQAINLFEKIIWPLNKFTLKMKTEYNLFFMNGKIYFHVPPFYSINFVDEHGTKIQRQKIITNIKTLISDHAIKSINFSIEMNSKKDVILLGIHNFVFIKNANKN